MNYRKIANAIVMVTGTSVGSGLLGLPIMTSTAGMIPTLCAFIAAWIFMTMAAYAILTIKLQWRGSYNLSSLIKHTLGRSGQYASSVMIVLLLYSLLCTYTMAGGAWLRVFMHSMMPLSSHVSTLLFTALLGSVLCCGDRFVYNLNNALGIGLVLAFIATVGSGLLPNDYAFISQRNLRAILPSMPLILTTFGFSIVVPSLTEYLDYDEKSVKIAILVGSLIALMAYVLWEWVTLGHISLKGNLGFDHMKRMGDDGTGVMVALAHSTNRHWILLAGRWFAVFAVVTSFLGVSLALMHFLSDALTLQCKGRGRLMLFGLTYLPPVIVTCFYPNAFVQILSFAGIFVAVLLGLFPLWMVLKTRSGPSIGFNNAMWLVGVLFFMVVIAQELVNAS